MHYCTKCLYINIYTTDLVRFILKRFKSYTPSSLKKINKRLNIYFLLYRLKYISIAHCYVPDHRTKSRRYRQVSRWVIYTIGILEDYIIFYLCMSFVFVFFFFRIKKKYIIWLVNKQYIRQYGTHDFGINNVNTRKF